MRRPTIQLQNEDGSHCKFITRSEAATLQSSKAVKRIHSKKAKRLILRRLPAVEASESKPSGCSISMQEMQAYVGLGEPAQIHAARVKVALFHPALHGASAVIQEPSWD